MKKDTLFYSKNTLNIGTKLLTLDYPIVMGIINVTPDSFYADSRKNTTSSILEQAKIMLKSGATILDIGGYSSRPDSTHISVEEELNRVCSAIEIIIKEIPEAIISIDTFRSEVARAAVEKGASIINDISGGSLDDKMLETVAELQVPYVMMHMRGNPQTMTKFTEYDNLIDEMLDYFQSRILKLKNLGHSDIIIDPGFGFSKTLEQNYDLLSKLEKFEILGYPLLAGLSRKSMIYKKLNIKAEESLNGTTVLNTIALSKGAKILRVHDVKETHELTQLYAMLDQ